MLLFRSSGRVGLVGRVLAFLALPAFASLQDGTRPNLRTLPAEPLFFTVTPAAELTCQIGVDMLNRRVSFRSRHFPSGKHTASRAQSVATPFWPTRVLPFERDHLIVAGRRDTGNTVIELWTVKWPAATSQPSGAGGLTVAISNLSLARVVTLHDAATPGKDTVVGMTRLYGQPGSEKALLVYFEDSKSLHQANIEAFFTGEPNPTCNWTLLASPVAGQGGLVVPALCDSRRFEWFGFGHADHGFVYCLRNSASDDPPLLLCDSDRDRVFDYSLLIPDHRWESFGLLDPASAVAPTY
jgi:hypothetical protein